MKNIIKSIFAALALLALAAGTVAYAAGSTNESSEWATVLVTDKGLSNSTWSTSTTVSEGEALNVQLHYYLAEGDSAQDMRFAVENLSGKTFNAGHTESVSGSVMADNLSSSNGTASVTFTDKVRLDLYNVSWQKGGCTSVGCESGLVDGAGKVLTSNGMSIGNVEGYTGTDWNGKHYNGNVIVTFKVTKVDDDPVNPPSNDDVEVTTLSATDIDDDSAELRGELEQGDNETVWFVLSSRNSNPSCSTGNEYSVSDRQDAGDRFSRVVTGLDDDTTYYFRACTNDDSGSVRSFTTDDSNGSSNGNDGEPTVETEGVNNITEDSARVTGSFDLNDADDGEFWFRYGTDSDLDDFDSTTREEYSSDKEIDTLLRNLDEDEKYYYQAVLRADGDTYLGDIRSFTTDEAENDSEVEAITNTAGDISTDGAEMRGYADLDGASEAQVYFEYGRAANALVNRGDSENISDDANVETDISGLAPCTTYFYRLVVKDLDTGRTDRGDVRSFKTFGDNCNGGTVTPPTATSPEAITRIASGVTSNSATLRSYVLGDGTGSCYFQYGRTQSFGLTSPAQTVNLGNTGECSTTRFNLVPNTTYYYRAVLVNGGQTEYGLTRSFRTSSAGIVTTPRPPVVTPQAPNNEVVVRVVESNESRNPLEVTKWVSAFDDPRFDTETEADRNETVFYKVRVTNNTTDVLEDLTVIDRIPFYLELDGQQSLDDDADKEVRWNVGRLQPGDSREFTTEMRVRDDARYGDTIESYATASNEDYNVNSNDVFIEVEEDEPAVVDTVDGNQTASIFGAGFFPTTLAGWLVLLGAVLAIAYLISRILFSRRENERVLAEIRAMQSGANR